jgi:hypothetical protein
MKKSDAKKSKLSRRKFLPFLGGSLLLPLLGLSKSKEQLTDSNDDLYETLLTKDGKAVKVKKSTLNNSKIVDKQISNNSLLNWLTPKNKKS